MTFREVILQLEKDVETAEKKSVEAQDPNGRWAEKQYIYLLSQQWANHSLINAKGDLTFFIDFLNEYKINLDDDTGGLEILILRLERKSN